MSSGFRSPIRLALGETRVQLRLLVRNPVSVLFTVALPLLLLPLLEKGHPVGDRLWTLRGLDGHRSVDGGQPAESDRRAHYRLQEAHVMSSCRRSI